jgi:hypothetical protein
MADAGRAFARGADLAQAMPSSSCQDLAATYELVNNDIRGPKRPDSPNSESGRSERLLEPAPIDSQRTYGFDQNVALPRGFEWK